MHILHISDTHGKFPIVNKNIHYDMVVHSGDILPNSKAVYSYHDDRLDIESNFQENFISHASTLESIKDIVKDKPFAFIPGNHDFLNPYKIEKILKQNNIDATYLNLIPKSILDYSFIGFPYINEFSKILWMYENDKANMYKLSIDLKNVIVNSQIDVIVAHSPIHGILDYCNAGHVGSEEISDVFSNINKDFMPSAFLHGHIHENVGIAFKHQMIISNASCTYNIISID